MFFGTPVLPTV